MKTSTKLILAGTATIVAAAAIFGTVQVAGALNQLAAPVKHSISLGTPTPTAASTEVPVAAVPADRSVQAEKESGLTPERYAALKSEATAAASNPAITSARALKDAISGLTAKFGKPIVVVAQYKCTGGGAGWGITGALSGNSASACGLGDSASETAILAEVDRRAGVEGWTSADYILVITSIV